MQNTQLSDKSMVLLISAFFCKPLFFANLDWPIQKLLSQTVSWISSTPAGLGLKLQFKLR